MSLVLVGIGGFLGGIARFELGRLLFRKCGAAFYAGTFFVNVTGAFLLGVLTSLDAGKNTYLLLGDGFLGAYTTFSAFMYDGFSLFSQNKTFAASLYIFGCLLLGIAGYAAGFAVGKGGIL